MSKHICEECGEEYYRSDGRNDQGDRNFCSPECYDRNRYKMGILYPCKFKVVNRTDSTYSCKCTEISGKVHPASTPATSVPGLRIYDEVANVRTVRREKREERE